MINILIREFAPQQAVADRNALEQFQKQWSTYQKLVDADAVSHRAAGKFLHDALYAIPRPFVVLRRRPPDGESTLWVMHDHDTLGLHVDHGLQRFWQLPMPLGNLGPDGVAQLVLRVRCHRNFAVLPREQKP